MKRDSKPTLVEKLHNDIQGFGLAILAMQVTVLDIGITAQGIETLGLLEQSVYATSLYAGLVATSITGFYTARQIFGKGSELLLGHDLLSDSIKLNEKERITSRY